MQDHKDNTTIHKSADVEYEEGYEVEVEITVSYRRGEEDVAQAELDDLYDQMLRALSKKAEQNNV